MLKSRRVVFAGFGLASIAFACLAAGPDDKGGGEGKELLQDVGRAYKALRAYADEGKVREEVTIAGKAESRDLPLPIRFERPNKLVLDAGDVQVVSDGERLMTSVAPLKKVMTTVAPPKLRLDSFDNNSLGAFLFSGPTSPALQTLLTFLFSDRAADDLLTSAKAVRLEADETVDGKALKTLLIEAKQGPNLRLLVDAETKLVRRIELLPPAADLDRAKDQSQAAGLRVVWTSGPISTEPAGVKDFHFEPPKGFGKVAELKTLAPPRPEQKSPLEELVGQPAPDFTLTVLADNGKMKEVRKVDLAGKVVLVDFWATWCPPCLAELPEIQRLVDAYRKANKDVVVVALSQDSEPGDLEGVRKLVETTLADKQLSLAQGPVSMVALDAGQTIGRAFHVAGIPSVVLIDAKGVVQAVHVGFHPDVRDTLTNEIDTLLEGKPLAETKPKVAPPH